MLNNYQRVIFATFSKCKALLVNNVVDAINPTSFSLLKTKNSNPITFKNFFDIQEYLRQHETESLSDTLLILDYEIIENSNRTELAEAFLLYPELKIKIFVERESVKTIFGIPEKKLRRCNLLIRNIKELIEAGYAANNDNMIFDPSGIRNELKMEMIESIGFTSNNYILKQRSRKENFGISIDYDPYHALFVGYALYNFGYSVIPVISYNNLEFLSNNKAKANLVCRECDLQLFDMKRPGDEKTQSDNFSDQLFKSRGIETDGGDKRKIIKIRNELYENLLEKDNGVTWFVTQYEKIDEKKIWKKLKAEKFLDIKFGNQPTTENPFYIVSCCDKIEEKRPEFKRFGIISKEGSEAALLRGQTKVIKGIYSLLKCPEVKRVYERAIDIYEVNRLRKERKYHDKVAVNLKFAREMVKRAKSFLLDNKYLESAVLSCDAIELSNGLSMTLSLEALHLKLQAETRLELMISGIGTLKETDLREKIREIKINILRVCKKNDEAKRNTLIQYFNGLRLIYNEFEQFEAAETLYSEVSKIEGGISRYLDQELNKEIEKATGKKAIKKNEDNPDRHHVINLSKADKFKVHLKTLICNPNFWLLFILVILLTLDCFMDSQLFPICYFGLFIGFCMFPKRAIFTIIGAGIDFRRFISSFLGFQVIMVFIYLYNYDYSKIPCSLNSIGSVQQKVIIITNTFLSSFINQPSPTFNLMMENQTIVIHWIINFHMAITVIFLGIFISAVYRWITKR
jgi:hypothetical protein